MTDMTDATADETERPTLHVEWYGDGDLTILYHRMSGVLLHAIAATLQHEAEKLLFQADVVEMQKNGRGRLHIPGRDS
jgi:hypothetical protein